MLGEKRKGEIDEEILYKEVKDNAVSRSLKSSIKDGAAASVTTGLGDNFISAYAIALGATNFQLSILSALPTLMPGEWLSTKFMDKFSRKRIVLTGVLIQAILWLPIALLSLLFLKDIKYAPLMLIIFYSVYMFSGFFFGPSWSSWMRDLTDGIERGSYFGRRNKILGIAGLTATVSAGLILDWFKNRELVFVGFGMIFAIAGISRLISRHYLKQQYEPKLKLTEGYYFSFWQFLKKAPTNNYGRFAIFLASMNFATAIAGPFFAPYLLKSLGFSYITFTIVNLIASTAATLLVMPFWGRFNDYYGNVKTMQLTAFLVPVIPFLWLVSPSPYYLIGLQVFSGICWAGFNLAAGSFTYDAVTKPRMGLCVAYTGTLSSMGIFLGSVVGGLLASYTTISMNIYLFVFVVSGLARLTFAVLLSGKIKEVRPNIKPMKLHWKIWKPLDHTPFRRIGEITELPMHLLEKRRE